MKAIWVKFWEVFANSLATPFLQVVTEIKQKQTLARKVAEDVNNSKRGETESRPNKPQRLHGNANGIFTLGDDSEEHLSLSKKSNDFKKFKQIVALHLTEHIWIPVSSLPLGAPLSLTERSQTSLPRKFISVLCGPSNVADVSLRIRGILDVVRLHATKVRGHHFLLGLLERYTRLASVAYLLRD